MSPTVIEAPSPNWDERAHPLDMLVLHYTGMQTGAAALARLRDPEAKVSAHYVVEEDGRIFALVPEARRAWHAGRSIWRGQGDLNSRSIGVEIVNGGHEFGLPPYPDLQIGVVIDLCRSILSRWPIPQARIVGHSDIAPDRKEDPGELFPWRRLADAGIGLWPTRLPPFEAATLQPGASGPLVERLHAQLSRIGYDAPRAPQFDEPTRRIVLAFQRRWRPHLLSGEADPETRALVAAVADLADPPRDADGSHVA